VTIELGAVADNTLYETSTSALRSNGAGAYLFAGRTFEGRSRRAVLRFDFSTIPAGAVIQEVSLTLNVSRKPPDVAATPMTVHRLLAPWGEGSTDAPGVEGQGAAPTPGSATWYSAFSPDVAWLAPGGDFDPLVSASQTVDLGAYTWSAPDLAADVQDWLDAAAPNHGWLILGDESSLGSARRFDSRENATPGNRPRLTVTYLP